jgi:hypothetical protein
MPEHMNEMQGEMQEVGCSHEALSLGKCDGRQDNWECPDCRTTWWRRCNRDKKSGVHPLPPMEGSDVKDAKVKFIVENPPGEQALINAIIQILLLDQRRKQEQRKAASDSPEPQPLADPRTRARQSRTHRKRP